MLRSAAPSAGPRPDPISGMAETLARGILEALEGLFYNDLLLEIGNIFHLTMPIGVVY